MKFYGIYKITNKVNGKMYIGKHITDNLDDGYLGSGVYICNAVKKYGKEAFSKEWLEFAENAEDLNYLERMYVDEEWIARPDTYNLAFGGDGGWDYVNTNGLTKHNGMLNKHHSAKTKEKMSLSKKGSKNPMFGVESPFKGKHHSEDTKKKFKVSISAYAKDGKLIGIYDSLNEAAIATSCSKSKICAVCRGDRLHTKNIVFKYTNGKGQFGR